MRTEDVLAQIDEALDDWDVGPDAMRCGAPPEALTSARRGAPRPGFVMVTFAANFERAAAEFQRAVEQVNALIGSLPVAFESLLRAWALKPYDADHPKPLAIDGHAYRRRVRRRSGR